MPREGGKCRRRGVAHIPPTFSVVDAPRITRVTDRRRSRSIYSSDDRTEFISTSAGERDRLNSLYARHRNSRSAAGDMAFAKNYSDDLVAFVDPPVYYPDHGTNDMICSHI